MYAMRMAAFALGLLAAGPAMAQTAQSQTGTAEQQQTKPMPPMPGMGMGHGHGMGRGMGMSGQGPCGQQQGAVEVTPDSVKARLEARLERMGNARLKVGEVTKQADGTILATVVTKKENVVVDKFVIDPKTGSRTRVD